MSNKLSIKKETIRELNPIPMIDLDGVVGGAEKKKPAPKKPNDNGKAGFMRIWKQIQDQQSGSYI